MFLLLGAIVNVAVAWGFASRADFDFNDAADVTCRWGLGTEVWYYLVEESGYSAVLGLAAFSVVYEHLGPERFVDLKSPHEAKLALQTVAPHWVVSAFPTVTDSSGRYREEFEVFMASGWPCRSHWCGIDWGKTGWTTTLATGGLAVPAGNGRQCTLPFIPVWRGAILNSAFYASLLYVLFFGGQALRRWRRVRRGLCPACAYPIGTSAVCTECGAPVPLSPGRGLGVRAVRATARDNMMS